MFTNLRRFPVLAAMFLAAAIVVLGGCRTNAQTGALIGAAAGAAGGYMIGNETDKDHHHGR